MKRVSLYFLFLFILVSCSQKKEILVKKVDIKPEIKEFHERLEESYRYGEYDTFLLDSKEFLTEFKENIPEQIYYSVVLNRAIILIKKNDYQKAKTELNKLLKSDYLDNYNTVYFYYAVCEYNLNKHNSALKYLSYFNIDDEKLGNDIKKDYYLLKANICNLKGEDFNSISFLIKAYDYVSNVEDKANVNLNVLSKLSSLSLNDLNTLLDLSRGKVLEPVILYTYAESLFEAGNFQKAIDMFSYLVKYFPESEYYNLAKSYVAKINNFKKVEPFNIGVVLPLTGRMAPYGMKSLNGIQLAADVFNSNESNKNTPLRLYIADSKGDPNLAILSLNKLLEENNVSAIIGDLVSSSALKLSEQCEIMKITNFTLSNNNRPNEIFNYLFNITVGYKDQIDKLLWYAMDELSIENFGILYPEDDYGRDLSSYFWDKVLEKGGKVTSVQSYEVDQNDFKEEISNMFGLNSVKLRREEYDQIVENLKIEHGENYNPYKHEAKLVPVKSFDAIFIPDDAKTFSKIAPYFAYYDVEGVIPLGPNTWNSKNLIERGGKLVEGATFVDAISKKSLNEDTKDFYSKFLDVFERYPGLIEAQAYDATNIIISSLLALEKDIGESNITRENLNQQIYRTRNYQGATGNLQINDDGTIKKDLIILNVQRGKIVEIKNN